MNENPKDDYDRRDEKNAQNINRAGALMDSVKSIKTNFGDTTKKASSEYTKKAQHEVAKKVSDAVNASIMKEAAPAVGAAIATIGAPFLIAILIVAAILLLLLLFIGLFTVLSPRHIVDTMGEYTQEKAENINNGISSFWDKIRLKFEGIDWIEADDSEYDSKNEIDVGYIESYNLINTMLNKSYGEIVYDKIESYCKQKGYDVDRTFTVLNDRYPNGWESVYADVNYGELINILGLGYYAGSYGKGVENGDEQALQKFLLDEENWRYFFNVNFVSEATYTYEIEVDNPAFNKYGPSGRVPPKIKQEVTCTYANFLISPYCISDLFTMLHINKDDMCIENISYFDMLDLMLQQDQVNCTSDTGPRSIYYTLHLDSPGASWENSFSSDTSNDIFIDSGIIVAGGSNPETVYKTLQAAGYSPEGIAGIMGNVHAESGFNTSIRPGDQGSIGICQWRGSRADRLKAYASAHNLAVDSIEAQAGFLAYEFPSQVGSKYDFIKNATDTITACDTVAKYFERCAFCKDKAEWSRKYSAYSWSRFTWSETYQVYIIDLSKRRSAALKYYNAY